MKRVLVSRSPGRGVAVTGLVLAGGRGRRAGNRDKGLIPRHGVPMARQAVQRLAPLCERVVISANRHLTRYAGWADVVTADVEGGYLGPLAGIEACLRAVRTRWLLTLPCDALLPAADLHARLLLALRLAGGAEVAVARDSGRLQPLLLALRGDLGPSLRRYLRDGGRSAHGWLAGRRVVEVRSAGHIGNLNFIPSTVAFDEIRQADQRVVPLP